MNSNRTNKIVIYNETPETLTDKEALVSVLDVVENETESIYGGPYIVGENDIITVIQNKKSIAFRVARVTKRRV